MNTFKITRILEILLLLVIAITISWQYIDRTPKYDEFYHINAAKGYLDSGEFKIQTGLYARASVYTWLVAQSISYFGDNLVAARLPSFIAGLLLVLLVFSWVRHQFDTKTAWLAALFLAASPILVSNMQFCRFYTLHAFLFFLLFVSVYKFTEGKFKWDKTNIVLLLIISISLIAALYFQESTLIGLFFILVWVVLYLLWVCINKEKIKLFIIFITGAFLLSLIIFSIFYSEILHLLKLFNNYPLWAKGNVDNKFYYLYLLREQYPILTALLPVSILISIYKYPRGCLPLIIIFLGGFIVHSLAASKSERYILYIIPFFYIVTSVAIVALLKHLYAITVDTCSKAFICINIKSKNAVISLLASFSVFVSVLYIVLNTEAIKSLPVMVLNDGYIEPYVKHLDLPDWRKAHGVLDIYKKQDIVVVSSAGVKAYYYIGQLDYDINASVANEAGEEDLAIDWRTGAKVIRSIETMREIFKTNNHGVIIIEAEHKNNSGAVTEKLTKYIEENTKKVIVQPGSNLYIYEWSNAKY